MRISRKDEVPCLWYELTGLATHLGHVTGIQRAITGVAHALLERPPDGMAARFCVFRRRQGFFEVEREEVESLLAETRAARPSARATPGEKLVRRVRKQRRRRGPAGRAVRSVGRAAEPRLRELPGEASPDDRADPRRDGRPLRRLHLRRAGARGIRSGGRPSSRCSPATGSCSRATTPRWCSAAPMRSAAMRRGSSSGSRSRRRRSKPCGSPATSPRMRKIAAPVDPVRPRAYVLYVSTLDVRKNHRLLFQVWKRLIAKHGADAVPDLVCVGRKGALTDDFLSELENARHLGGRIVVEHDVDDAGLARLYAGCLFTVFPSIAEGWGIPVTESLAHGKYCVASNASSLPEVGGDLIDYHDPVRPRRPPSG